jgi:D-alanyl-D-alanine carboxypeptidase (penicillin-binding protein 5/6)
MAALLLTAGVALAPTSRAEEDPGVSVICVEASTGLVIHEAHADVKRPPASMVKLMQMLVVDEGLEAGSWTLETPVRVSPRAQAMGGTQVYLEAGETWPLGKLMQAVAVASANDAAMAVAQGLWGSEQAYLAFVNKRAAELGMKDTEWHSVHGLPPDPGEEFDQTTARDMATLARACVERPRIMDWVGIRELDFKAGGSTKFNTNKLLWRMENCDGLKTGYIRAAGFCIAATAQRNGVRLISVVMGSPSKYGRFNLAEEVMESGFREVGHRTVIHAGELLSDMFPVAYCDTPETALVSLDSVEALIRKQDLSRVKLTYRVPEVLEPPLTAQEVVGHVEVSVDGRVLGVAPVAVPHDLNPNGWRLVVSRGVARWEGLDADQDAS